MMISYINATESQGFHHFQGKIPTIFQIQDLIEHAWDLGINAQCRLETGGIRGTRKYIGTPEVSLEIAEE
jgi:zinc finger-containing ubiquitin peptidase 1